MAGALATMFLVPENNMLDDRQLDEILARLDRIAGELERVNSRLDTQDGLQRIAHEVRTLNESLQALAFATLGAQSGPVVKRRSA